MVKITELPLLDPGAMNGLEAVPIVKAGVMGRTPLAAFTPSSDLIGYFLPAIAAEAFAKAYTDPSGNVIFGHTVSGRTHAASLAVGPVDEASTDVPRLEYDPATGGMVFRGRSFKPSEGEIISLEDLSGTEWAEAAEITCDAAGFVLRVVWRDGTCQSTETIPGASDPTHELVEFVPLPNGALAQNPNGGWTGTGADQIDRAHPWAGCWLVGNHGQATEGNGPYTSSVVLLDPSRRVILKEWPMPAGAQSVQGVARGFAPNTFWVVDKRPDSPADSMIRLFNFDGQEDIAQRITTAEIVAAAGLSELDFEFNGIALHPGAGPAGSLWIACEGRQRAFLFDLASRAITRTLTVGMAGAADQLGYDAAADWLYFSYGNNGSDGNVRFLNGTTGAIIGTLLSLTLCQAIEGVKIDCLGRLVVFNDGAYHTVAKPPLATSIAFNFDLGVTA